MRKTALLAAMTAALLPLALAACSSSDTASGATTQPSQPVVTPTAPATTSAAATAVASATPASDKTACTAKNFTADLNVQPPELSPEPNTGKAMLALTNKSGHSCTLHGWAGVGFFAANDSALDVPVKKVDQPGPATDVTVKNGETAFAGVKWTTCDKGDESCKVSTTVRITPPGASSAIVANFIGDNGQQVLELPVSQVQVGTLQPSHEGVVAW